MVWSGGVSALQRLLLLGALLLLVVMVAEDAAAAAPYDKRNVGGDLQLKLKRPFCNAFTGCGRKRSSAAIELSGPELLASSDGQGSQVPLVLSQEDNRAELDELARHVLAQARLWEQLQQKVELMRSLASGYPDPAPMALYRRKRGALAPLPPPASNPTHLPRSSLRTLHRQQEEQITKSVGKNDKKRETHGDDGEQQDFQQQQQQ